MPARTKSRHLVRHATQAAQKLEELGEVRAANDIRALCRYTKIAAGTLSGIRKRENAK